MSARHPSAALATGTITMTMREMDRYEVIQAIVDTGLEPNRAAGRWVSSCVRLNGW
jgi:hypothetical protein